MGILRGFSSKIIKIHAVALILVADKISILFELYNRAIRQKVLFAHLKFVLHPWFLDLKTMVAQDTVLSRFPAK